MLRATTISRAVTFAALTVAFVATSASAALRAPQVTFQSAALQTFINSIDGGINVNTDQQDAQVLATGYSGNTDFTLFTKNSPAAALGIYNGYLGVPVLDQLFSPGSIPGYRAVCHFDNANNVAVSFLDDNGLPIGGTNYSGIDRNYFGWYITTDAGTKYSQDGRNGPGPQMLAFYGTGPNFGDIFLCFEQDTYNPGTSDFNDAFVVVQSVVPTPTKSSTWGKIKATYR